MLRRDNRVDLIFAPASGLRDESTPTVVVSLRNDLDLDPSAPDRVDGKPARIGDTEIDVYGIAGSWSLRVTAQPDNLLGSGANLLAFVQSVRVVPNPDDRSTWVTPPS